MNKLMNLVGITVLSTLTSLALADSSITLINATNCEFTFQGNFIVKPDYDKVFSYLLANPYDFNSAYLYGPISTTGTSVPKVKHIYEGVTYLGIVISATRSSSATVFWYGDIPNPGYLILDDVTCEKANDCYDIFPSNPCGGIMHLTSASGEKLYEPKHPNLSIVGQKFQTNNGHH